MPVARVVAKGLIKGDSLLAVHKITLEKLSYKDSIITEQRKLIVNRDSTVLIERELNAQLRAEMNKKDQQIDVYKQAAIISDKKYKQQKFRGNLKTTGIIVLAAAFIASVFVK